MRTLIVVMMLAASVPCAASTQTPKADTAAKPHLICRVPAGQPARTAVKLCRTEEDWKAIDRADERQSQSYLRGRDRPGM